MHVLVATVVHHPQDARILHRQIRSLLDAGHTVTYAAPFRARGVTPWPEVIAVDLPRARGRRRLAALRAARSVLAEHAAEADLLLVHDPELLMALPGRRPVTVWDVHDDLAAALPAKEWVPLPLRRPLGPLVRVLERAAERRVRLLLAEEGYRDRFAGDHPVVPNTTVVPEAPARPPGTDRVVYLGRLSTERGAAELVATGRLLRARGVSLEVVGPADPPVRALLRQAQREDSIRWYGFLPNDQALRLISGATAGLCLPPDSGLRRHEPPTRVVEYMAHGIPVVTTPDPATRALVSDQPQGPCGTVVPFGDPEAAAAAVLRLRGDGRLRSAYARAGHAIARARFHWPSQAEVFVRTLEEWARSPRPQQSPTFVRRERGESGGAVRPELPRQAGPRSRSSLPRG
ncbi:glycosyltransferase family 4 protein [Actinorugispora endophytica]|nr:glycosyltransferase family 4 protein [Actinorugispora endophytica]